MTNNLCPACYTENSINLESIDLELQHAFYSPGNVAVQNELTKAISLSSQGYKMLKCTNCGLEYASPLVSPYTDWYGIAYKALSLYPAQRWECNYVLNHLQSSDLIAELGCGVGFFLKKCKSKKINCHGFDFSKDVIDKCLTDNLTVSLMDLSNTNSTDNFLEKSKFNSIVSFHVLEHLDNPSQLFNFAWRHSLENADLWISVPSDKRLTRLFQEQDFLDQPPHHLTRWNANSLEKIGHHNGWDLKEIIYEPISLKQILWSYSTRFFIYKKIKNKYKNLDILIDRIFRYSLYPFALIWWLITRNKITGFTMLAKYSKNKTFQ